MKKLISLIFGLLIIHSLFAQKAVIDSFKQVIKNSSDSAKSELLFKMALNFNSRDSGMLYIKRALAMAKKFKKVEVAIKCYGTLTDDYYNRRKLDSAIATIYEEIAFIQQADSMKTQGHLGEIYNKLGVNYQFLGKYNKSAESYTNALKIFEENKDFDGLASTELNLGNIYYYYLNNDKYTTALKYYRSAEKYAIKAQNGEAFVRTKINIAQVYKEKSKVDSAIILTNQVLSFVTKNYKSLNTPNFLYFQAYLNLGSLYTTKNQFKKAEHALLTIINKYPEIMNISSYKADVYGTLGPLYQKWGKTRFAISYYEKSIALYTQLGYRQELSETYKYLSKLYSQQGNYKLSLKNFQSYSDLKDSLFNAEITKQITEMQAKYQSEKKEKEIELLTKEQEKQKLVNQSIMAVSVLIVIVGFLVFRSYLQKKKANAILQQQNDEISKQKEQIEEQSEEIKDSIKYASRIQRAVLPPVDLYEKLFSDYFILFRPRDIVSGDFYWMAEKNEMQYIVAADCTGHGVPGAFMSMLGISFLNEIINKESIDNAADILNDLREHIIHALRQTGKANEAKDGMDIAISVIDKKNMKIQFAGAYNPLYLIRDGELKQFKADKMPIGIYFRENKPFTNTIIDIQPNDNIYMFSDGFVDQFGGAKGRKFMSKRFKELLLSIADEPLKKQGNILDVKLDMWREERPQIDDVLVLGIKI